MDESSPGTEGEWEKQKRGEGTPDDHEVVTELERGLGLMSYCEEGRECGECGRRQTHTDRRRPLQDIDFADNPPLRDPGATCGNCAAMLEDQTAPRAHLRRNGCPIAKTQDAWGE